MNGQKLLEWLQEFPEWVLSECEVKVEGTGPLVTAKIYDEDHDGKPDTIYLIYK